MVRMTERAQHDPPWRATMRLARARERTPDDFPHPSREWLTLIRAALQASKESDELRRDLDVDAAAWQLTAHVIGMHSLTVDLPRGQSAAHQVRQLWDVHRSMLASR